MTLPTGLATVTVTAGPYTDASGAPLTGTITFTPNAQPVWTATGAAILSTPVVVALNGSGVASVALPATDASGLSEQGWTYTATFDLTSPTANAAAALMPVTFPLPHTPSSVALELLANLNGGSL